MYEITNRPIHVAQHSHNPDSYTIGSTIPFGQYIVDLCCMKLVATNDGLPAVVICFVPEDGSGVIMMFQPIKSAFQIHTVNELLRTMTGQNQRIEFNTYMQYGWLLDETEKVLIDNSFQLCYYPTKHGETIEISPA